MDFGGLGGLDADSDSSQSSDSSSSSSGSSDTTQNSGPDTQLRSPYCVVYRDEDGDWRSTFSPQDEDLMLEFTRESSSDSWSLNMTPSYFERYWMSQSSYRTARHTVKKVTGGDLTQMLRKDPEQAVTAVIESAKVADTDRDIPETRTCPVCQTELHRVYDKSQKVNGYRLCPDHTVAQIKEAGVMDSSGTPSNRMWE